MSTPYTLPELGYPYDALEPHISAIALELHHKKHHAAYVKAANETLAALDDARSARDYSRLAALERTLAFNLSGHVLHSIFWRNLGPGGVKTPKGALMQALERDFGSFAKFREQQTEVASSIMGSGWAVLVWEPIGKRLLTTQIYDHQSNLSQAGVPIMVLDAWEHAYYLQYQNRKRDFFEAIWNVWNWDDIAERFEAAQRLRVAI